MSRSLRWREAARADLLNLLDWIADRADLDTAEAYVARVEHLASKLIATPFIGTPRDELSPELRSLVHARRTIIFYRVTSTETVEIVRIAHGGRELGAMFDERD